MKTKVAPLLMLSVVVLISCDPDDPQITARTGVSGNITTIPGSGPSSEYSGDGGPAINAKMSWITSVAVDGSNNVYIADGAANTVRKVEYPSMTIETIAGKFIGFNVVSNEPLGDGVLATNARLTFPTAIAVDKSGNLLISDASSMLIRKVDASNNMIRTVAGNLTMDYPGDGSAGTSIGIWNPYGVVFDASGNIYYADSQNNAVRKINKADGKVTTIAGLGTNAAGYSGDNGPATSAKLNMPQGLAIDKSGNLYIADGGNHVVRKISNGIISTVAGTGAMGDSGNGGAATTATFMSVKSIAVDQDNNLFIADASANVIRKVDGASGIITAYAGTGESGYSGDEGPATSARLGMPWGIAVDGAGNLYIADSNNGVVRLVYK